MANTTQLVRRDTRVAALVIGAYTAVAIGTVVALAVLSQAAPSQAPQEAWGHVVIVAVFAVVLVVRWRAAQRGSAGAQRAVRVIAGVLTVVNLVEACLPAFPVWLRVEMLLIACLMLALTVRLPLDARR